MPGAGLRPALFAGVVAAAPGFLPFAWFAVCAVAAKLQIVTSIIVIIVQKICILIKAECFLILSPPVFKITVLIRRRGLACHGVLRGCRVLFEPLLQLPDVSLELLIPFGQFVQLPG